MTETQKERELQRSESEARDIIHDIDRLNTFPENKKSRWVWELLQNAKDVATENGVDIIYELKENDVIFSHNGAAFETKHLLAILYKTSTKSLDGKDGTTGKYGTGFVTTHVLSKKLLIQGVHQKKEDLSLRKFELEIDRTVGVLDESTALEEMKQSLLNTFQQIDKIVEQQSSDVKELYHSFIYSTSNYSRKYAEQGLNELENNIAFVLLINQKEKKRINSITIIKNGISQVFTINPTSSKIFGLNYIEIGHKKGILFKEVDDLIIGIPVIEANDTYELQSVEGKCVLYKEFPLIGSENFHLPVLIQNKSFRPTEERDGIRTKKESKEITDATADGNRICLQKFLHEYLSFITLLIEAKCKGIYHLALSGLPEFFEKYHDVEWYKENIQNPIRTLILEQDIVETQSGIYIKIEETKFPSLELVNDDEFLELLTHLLPKNVPNKYSLKCWNININQERESWGINTAISLEQLLEEVPNIIDLNEETFSSKLKKVYRYLDFKNSTLGEIHPIYLNENCEFKTRDKVWLYPEIDDEIKYVSQGLGRDLDNEFLNKQLGNINGIKPFELYEFYKTLNSDYISSLKVEEAEESQVKAILHMNCLFKSDRAFKRENWLEIIKELLPDKINEKRIISIDYENFHTTAELWTAKYLCWLMQSEETFDSFKRTYFDNNDDVAYRWANRFLNYIFQSRDDIKGFISKFKIIPVQDGNLVMDSESIFMEDEPRYFDNVLKDISMKYCGFNSRSYLLCNQINIAGFRTSKVDLLTNKIDNLFLDANVESKVAKEGELHNVFLEINNWYEKFSDASSYLKTFTSKRNMLYVISLGDGFSRQIMALKESGKSMEDIAELAKINLTAQEMIQLEKVANELGTSELLKKAQEMILLRNQRIKWKKIGATAETAFKEIFSNLDMDIQLNNPDEGKDFEILLKSKNFSVEIKNVIEGKENVRMSILQGRTAVEERENYALCVVTRPNDIFEMTVEYFKENAKFVKDIGYQIGDKIDSWDEGLKNLSLDREIKVLLEDKKETVYINRNIWRSGVSFYDFIQHLQIYFEFS